MDLTLDTTFPANYSIERVWEIPQPLRETRWYFPEVSTDSGSDGPMLRFRPREGSPWLGTFGPGWSTFSTCIATPDPVRALVVVQGKGYLVAVDSPTATQVVDVEPIVWAQPVRDIGVIVLAGDIRVEAWNGSGRLWRSRRISWDGLRITQVDSGFVHGTCPRRYDADEQVPFSIDLRTGRHNGGGLIPDEFAD